MKRIFLFIIFSTFVVYSFSQNTCQIKGVVYKNAIVKEVLLIGVSGGSEIIKETAIPVGNKFEFNDLPSTNIPACLKIVSQAQDTASVYIFLEEGIINIDYMDKTDFNTSLSGYRKKGTRLNNLHQFFDDQTSMYSVFGNKEYQAYLDGKINGGFDIYTIMDMYRNEFIKENINNPLGNNLFEDYIDVLKHDVIQDIYNIGSDSQRAFIDKFRASEKKKEAKEKEEKESRSRIFDNISYYSGTTIKNLDMLSLSGDSVKLYDYIGDSEYTYIDIWASWCGPCIADIPKLKNIYDSYDRKILNIISISIDDRVVPWKNAINKNNIPWINLIEEISIKALMKNDPKLRDMYNIAALPAGFLVNKRGEIIISGAIRSFNLEKKMKELLNN